jgi:hypothetical protein
MFCELKEIPLHLQSKKIEKNKNYYRLGLNT